MISTNARLSVEIDARSPRMFFELIGISVLFAIGVVLIAVRVATVMGRMN
jgi:uncharacterized membrane protein YccC